MKAKGQGDFKLVTRTRFSGEGGPHNIVEVVTIDLLIGVAIDVTTREAAVPRGFLVPPQSGVEDLRLRGGDEAAFRLHSVVVLF